jgi:hypothetical protein
MITVYLDIETIPADTATLEAAMPEEIKSPVMPEEIAHPIEPDWAVKCPKYGGDEARRATWMAENQRKWQVTTNEAREKWQQQALDNRARFVESAALHAETGHVKLIGVNIGGQRSIYLWESDRDKVAIAQAEATRQDVVLFSPFMLEKQMFTRFARDFVAMMDNFPDPVPTVAPQRWNVPERTAARVITYYGNTFDLPFLARRAAICGEPALMRFLRMHRRGRYLDAARFVDLHEEWTLGDRETRTGGLSGLCKILGVECKSRDDGKTFYRWYQENPGEGIAYLLQDLRCVEAAAGRMGFK